VATTIPEPTGAAPPATRPEPDDAAVPPDAWWAVAGTDELSKVGRFVARDVGGQAVIAVRDTDRTLQILDNTCPHQDLPICVSPSKGGVRTLRCPFHGWAFSLDGRYVAPQTNYLLPAGFRAPQRVVESRRDLRRYPVTVVLGVVFAGLSSPDAGRPTGRKSVLSPRVLNRRVGVVGTASTSPVARPWSSVYEELLEDARSGPAAGTTSGDVRRLGANALAVIDKAWVRSVSAVVPRGSNACSVLVGHGETGDIHETGKTGHVPMTIVSSPTEPTDGERA
jgi:nitrite reductase/ring-hydroxylating ferredoxin subunit